MHCHFHFVNSTARYNSQFFDIREESQKHFSIARSYVYNEARPSTVLDQFRGATLIKISLYSRKFIE